MTPTEVEQLYTQILNAYVRRPNEESLLRALELGQQLVLERQRPDVVLEVHTRRMQAMLNGEEADRWGELTQRCIAPLLEAILGYGLAFHELIGAGDQTHAELEAAFDQLERLQREAATLRQELERNEERHRALQEQARRQGTEIASLRRARSALTSQMISKEEHERRRLALELHDGVIQLMTAALVRVEVAEMQQALAQEQRVPFLADLRDTLRECVTALRRLISNLHPPDVSGIGLAKALEHQVTKFESDTGVAATLQVSGAPRPLLPHLEVTVYRIVQEALTNVSKHAHARQVLVRLEFGDAGVSAWVRDDGEGFVPPKSIALDGASGHLGIVGMRERAAEMGGRLRVRSRPGAGTEVALSLPLPDVARRRFAKAARAIGSSATTSGRDA